MEEARRMALKRLREDFSISPDAATAATADDDTTMPTKRSRQGDDNSSTLLSVRVQEQVPLGLVEGQTTVVYPDIQRRNQERPPPREDGRLWTVEDVASGQLARQPWSAPTLAELALRRQIVEQHPTRRFLRILANLLNERVDEFYDTELVNSEAQSVQERRERARLDAQRKVVSVSTKASTMQTLREEATRLNQEATELSAALPPPPVFAPRLMDFYALDQEPRAAPRATLLSLLAAYESSLPLYRLVVQHLSSDGEPLGLATLTTTGVGRLPAELLESIKARLGVLTRLEPGSAFDDWEHAKLVKALLAMELIHLYRSLAEPSSNSSRNDDDDNLLVSTPAYRTAVQVLRLLMETSAPDLASLDAETARRLHVLSSTIDDQEEPVATERFQQFREALDSGMTHEALRAIGNSTLVARDASALLARASVSRRELLTLLSGRLLQREGPEWWSPPTLVERAVLIASGELLERHFPARSGEAPSFSAVMSDAALLNTLATLSLRLQLALVHGEREVQDYGLVTAGDLENLLQLVRVGHSSLLAILAGYVFQRRVLGIENSSIDTRPFQGVLSPIVETLDTLVRDHRAAFIDALRRPWRRESTTTAVSENDVILAQRLSNAALFMSHFPSALFVPLAEQQYGRDVQTLRNDRERLERIDDAINAARDIVTDISAERPTQQQQQQQQQREAGEHQHSYVQSGAWAMRPELSGMTLLRPSVLGDIEHAQAELARTIPAYRGVSLHVLTTDFGSGLADAFAAYIAAQRAQTNNVHQRRYSSKVHMEATRGYHFDRHRTMLRYTFRVGPTRTVVYLDGRKASVMDTSPAVTTASSPHVQTFLH